MTKMNKRIGILLDGTIRNLGSKVEMTFKRRFPDREILGEIDPFKPFNHLPLEDGEFVEFVCDSALEVYGKAELTYPNAIRDLNQMIQMLEEDGHEITLLSREWHKVRPATLFFLSECGAEVSGIKFIRTLENAWDECDLLVTANLEVLDTMGADKDAIIISYNPTPEQSKFGLVVEAPTLREVLIKLKPNAFLAELPEGTVEVQENYPIEDMDKILEAIKIEE
jgi:hypothetical protein